MAAAVQGLAAIGYVANNLAYGPRAIEIYQAVGSGGGEQHVVLPAGGHQGVSSVSQRRPASVQGTPEKRQRLVPRATPQGRFRTALQNRRRRRRNYTGGSIHRFVVSRRGRRPKFTRYFL